MMLVKSLERPTSGSTWAKRGGVEAVEGKGTGWFSGRRAILGAAVSGTRVREQR